ncbi:hypothetical protein G6F68_010050 [Rhizopus microsporus]|nr:hypothetical protein G6F68_010050 [Rhizopus microsporus]
MQDGPDQQRVRSLLPMVAPLQRAFGIDQNVRDVLHVAHFMRAASHLQQRVVGRRLRIRGVEQQAMREARAPAGGDLPVLALDVVDAGGRGPGKQCRHHQANAFAAARGRKGQDVFWAFMAQVLPVMLAEEHAGWLHRHADGNQHGDKAAAAGNRAANVEDTRCVGVEEEPPLEQPPRVIDRRAQEVEPGRAKAYLIAKGCCRPLCGCPHAGDHDAEYDGNLTEQHVRPLHDLSSDFSCAGVSLKALHRGCRRRQDRFWASAGQRPFAAQWSREKKE